MINIQWSLSFELFFYWIVDTEKKIKKTTQKINLKK